MCNDENGGKFKTKLFLAEINALCLPWVKNTHSASICCDGWAKKTVKKVEASKVVKRKEPEGGRETKSKREQRRREYTECGGNSKKDIQTAYCVRVFICVRIVDVFDGDAFTQRYVHTVSCERTKQTFVIDFCFWFLLKNFAFACAKPW